MTTISSLLPINVLAGVQPSPDRTPSSTNHWIYTDKIRFVQGFPRKIGGWDSVTYEYGAWPDGICRCIYSAITNNQQQVLLGTHTNVYALQGSRLTNITPLETTTHTIANSIATDYGTLASNPIITTIGSNVVTVSDTNAQYYTKGQTITLSGSTSVNGIPSGEINTAHVIRSTTATEYTFYTTTSATSSGTGGGASVVRATGRLTFTATSHGMSNGDRVKITGAATTGGILNTEINKEFIIYNKTTNAFDVFTTGSATSYVTSGGGASTSYQKQIAAGAQDESYGQGYGMGLYGVGLYGVAKFSTAGKRYPRIWFMDRFAENILMTAGNGTGLYTWAGSNATAPTLLSGAPTDINYMFVSDGIVVTFGAGGVNNHILASDQNDPTGWISSSVNQVFDDYIEGAGRLKSHVSVAGQNLIFTDTQTYRFKYIGLPLVWSIELLENNIGIISPNARICVGGVGFWMGQKNFYMWDGGNIQTVPANSQTISTILNYVYNNITASQRSKIFCWYNEQFSEIWWHYPAAGSMECDLVARLNVKDLIWSIDTMPRTAAEYPTANMESPLLIDQYGILYKHEVGNNADGQPLAFELISNKKTNGKKSSILAGFVPDSIQTGNINVTVDTYQRQQSTDKMFSESFIVTPETERVPISVGGRWWQYTITGNTLDQEWIAGNWMEFVQEAQTE